MIWIAVVIAIFLFYQFVPWKQKITLLKIMGGVVVLAGISIGIFSLYDEWKSEQRKGWKSVKFLYLKDSNEKGKKDIAIEVCNKRKNADLFKYELYVTGFESGRSTGMKIFKDYEYGTWEGRSEFKSDLIVKSDSCIVVVWTGNFRSYDRYEINSYDYFDVWAD